MLDDSPRELSDFLDWDEVRDEDRNSLSLALERRRMLMALSSYVSVGLGAVAKAGAMVSERIRAKSA